ncbi:MAG: PEP/pyruvate-binding domain-containing protein [Anaerolineales bacterium]|nr:PEP/pyruvate-binding domain-containing protein [Anaerolineales bacterium]
MLILGFDSEDCSIENSSGKAANLARLWKAGFIIPPGFILSTHAYQAFVQSNELDGTIGAHIHGLESDSPEQLQAVSGSIRPAFSQAALPSEIERNLRAAYAGFSQVAVAVRSSATTEDLPDLSFAGQQDTFLNVIGESALFESVINCWSSLWTARAVGYRQRNDIPHEGAAVAVIVQEMVQSEISGVLFTANPLTGLRSETVIDAAFGLGEALVSGRTDPDHFIFDTMRQEVTGRALGAKSVSTRSRPGGGVMTVDEEAAGHATLDDTQIERLASLGDQVQALLESPQDIEWAIAGRKIYLLQSRPITSLYPLPELSYDPLTAWISFGSVQGLLGPMTPLGRQALRMVIGGAAQLFGERIEPEQLRALPSAGERLWIRVSDVLRNPLGYRLFDRAARFVEASAVEILQPLTRDPRMRAGDGRLRAKTILGIARFILPALLRSVHSLLRPERARARFDVLVERSLANLEPPAEGEADERLARTLEWMRQTLHHTFVFLLPRFIPLFAPGMASLVLLGKIAGGREQTALAITRGLPGNVTTEMDLAFWQVSEAIHADSASRQAFATLSPNALAELCPQEALPAVAQEELASFLSRYGMRGTGEIDLGRQRWREDPAALMQSLQNYLRVPPEAAPDVVFAHDQRAAQEALATLVADLRRQRAGWVKAHLARWSARRIRALIGARKSPKFYAIRTLGLVRQALLASAERFVTQDTLGSADDLFFLSMQDLESLSQGEIRDWKTLVRQRRQTYAREARRRQVPRVLLNDGRAFHAGLGAGADTGQALCGSPVSPGTVEGRVRVVFDPHKARLNPGEILVCPGTDPAWTPLFLADSGLITEVGGMMTHGSVVAREYGIPAVVGVHQATSRLQNGQRIRLDGSTGTITLLNETSEDR